jgi:hypothetical protein
MSRTNIPDTTSGFRAYSRNAAKQLNVFTDYTYTLETIIQAGQKNMSIMSVDIKVNRVIRQSKLVKSMAQYIFKSILTIFRVYAIYKPSKFFLTIGSIIFFLGIRWLLLVYLIDDPNRTYLPSLILAATLLIIGFQTMALSFIGDLFSINRKLLEEIKFKLK